MSNRRTPSATLIAEPICTRDHTRNDLARTSSNVGMLA